MCFGQCLLSLKKCLSSLNQDTQIQELREQVSTLSLNSEQMHNQIIQQQSQIQQHKDQYNILKLKLGTVG